MRKREVTGFYFQRKSSLTRRDFLMLHLGVLLLTIGVYFFKYPNHFAIGGVSGMSVILERLLPFSAPMINLVLNILLLILGFAVFGRSFGFWTSYATLLLAFSQIVLEKILPLSKPMTHQPLLELFFAVLLPAAGSAILFNQGASSGGTDIIAKIVRTRSNLDIGVALLVSDAAFTLSAFFLFGPETGLFSTAGLLMKGVMIDSLIEGFNRVKSFTIVTEKPEEVGAFIREKLKRSATQLKGVGLFSHEERSVFLCVVNRYQALLLRNEVKRIDPHAFITVESTSEIIGKGFRSAP